MSYDVQTVKNSATNLWLSIVTSLCGVDAAVLDGRPQDCPKCGGSGSNDRFRAFGDFQETGGVVCNRCGKFADGIATIEWLNDCSFSESLTSVAEFLHLEPSKRDRVRKTSHRSSKRKRRKANKSNRSKNADLLKTTKWNASAAKMFVIRNPEFGSTENLELLGAKCGIYLSTLVIALPIFDHCQGSGTAKPVGYTIYPAIAAGIPYRGDKIAKTTIMV